MQEEKRIRDLEDALRRQDAMLLEVTDAAAQGMEEVRRLLDAILISTVQECATDGRLSIPAPRVTETLNRWVLAVEESKDVETGEGVLVLTVHERTDGDE